MMRPLTFATLLVATLAGVTPVRAQTSCAPEWTAGFTLPSPDKPVNAALQWNDGSGPALFVGGDFNQIDGRPAHGVARYTAADGWNNLGGGLTGLLTIAPHAQCFAVFDDGSGPALYMGGQFQSVSGVPCLNIARWNGTAWSALGAGLHYTQNQYDFVYALAVYDDGFGPKLYAAGRFTDSGGAPCSNIARWDGTNWSQVGGGIGGNDGDAVHALAVYDDGSGSGPMLYAGGAFSAAGGQPAPSLARWNGTNWSLAGPGADAVVRALRVFDFGSGPRLYAAGTFTLIGGAPANGVASWDGQQWSAVGNGLPYGGASLAQFDAGAGPELYLGSATAAVFTKLVGQNFLLVAGGPSSGNNVVVCEPYNLGTGNQLFIGGLFQNLSAGSLRFAASYDGSRWSMPSRNRGGLASKNSSAVAAAFQTVHHGGAVGTRSYVAGKFDCAGGVIANGVASFDGEHWSSIGDVAGGFQLAPARASALAEFDFGNGLELVVGGAFTSAGGVTSQGCARFDGVAWHSMGPALFEARQFAIHDDGSGGGPELYAVGVPLSGGGLTGNTVVRFDGTQWVALAPVSGTWEALALKSFDDGSGSKLYVVFRSWSSSDSSNSLDRLRRWDGASWSSIGVGLESNELPTALEVFDDGSGPRLYAGFYLGRVKSWDGAAWQYRFATFPSLSALFAHDDGAGAQLYAGCQDFPGPVHNTLLRWDGTTVASLAGGAFGAVAAIGVLEEPAARALYIGSPSYVVDALGHQVPSIGIARWASPCPSSGVTFCSGDGSASACPCGNAGASGHGCANSAAASGARLSASGVARLTQDTALLVGESMPDGPLLYFQGTARADPFVFGDGLKCTSGALIRLGIVFNSGGASTYPATSGTLAASGLVFAPGQRHYQARYRDSAAFCSPDTFNYTSGVTLTWSP